MYLKGFHDFVFKYYMEEGRRGKLLSSLMASHPQLGRLLNTVGNEYLSWLHHVGTNNMWKVSAFWSLKFSENVCVELNKNLTRESDISISL